MKFIVYIAVGLLLLASCKDKIREQQYTQPNIIYIMADDHAQQAISAYGHPIGKLAPTPNIDRIAEEGALFENNFCTNSICGPSRAVVLTGKHSHKNGFRMNGETFDGNQQTFPKILQKAGYQTAIIGKWHLHGYPQGFDYWNIINDQGNYYNPVFITQSDSALIDTAKINHTPHWTVEKGDTAIVPGYTTDLVTDYAIDYIKKAKDSKKPFMLMVHHKAPHRNWMPALRHANKYDSIKFPLPDSYFASLEGSTASQEQQQTIYQDMYEGHDLKMTIAKGSDSLMHNPWKTDFERMTPAQRKEWNQKYRAKNDAMHQAKLSGRALAEWKGQRYLQDYLATVAAVDEGVGRILDYLEESKLADNTLIVYTSDQGFYLGEKGWFDKRFMYEESFRMPLVMRYPKRIKAGTKIIQLTQNLDFAQTFLDFAQAAKPNNMQGQSLLPLLTGAQDAKDFRDAVYYHYYDFPAFHMVKRMYGVRTQRYKLIHVYDDIDEWELYDLQTDPKELNNLYGKKEFTAIQEKMHKKLKQVQTNYEVTDKEFEQTDPKKIKRSYKNFERLRGKTPTSFDRKDCCS